MEGCNKVVSTQLTTIYIFVFLQCGLMARIVAMPERQRKDLQRW